LLLISDNLSQDMPPVVHAARQNLFNDDSIGEIVRQQMLQRDRQQQQVKQFQDQRQKEQLQMDQRQLEHRQLEQRRQEQRQLTQLQQDQRMQGMRQQEQRQQEQREQDVRSRGSLIRELESMRRQGDIQKRQLVKIERLDGPEPNQRLLAQAPNCVSRRRVFHYPELPTRSNQTDGMINYCCY
jgi:hypothetical protein